MRVDAVGSTKMQPAGDEAGVDFGESDERPSQQRRADQHDERKRHLDRDERALDPELTASGLAGADSRRRVPPPPEKREGGQHTERDAGRDSAHRGEEKDASVEANIGESGNLGRRERDECARKSPPKRQSHDRPATRDDETFGEQLASEPRRRGAECRPGGNLGLASCRLAEHQGGDIDACDEEEKGNRTRQDDQ